VIGEFAREFLAVRINRKLKSTDVIDVLYDLFILRGIPMQVRSDHRPEFIAQALRDPRSAVRSKTAYIMKGKQRENGYCEIFNSKLYDNLLHGEIF
jgi:transposase InsO family protein